MKKLLRLSGLLAVVTGIILIIGGVWGITFTYSNVAQENIVTPSDASIPEADVRGPFTLKAQAEIIREHALNMTGGQTYAEMPRLVPELDDSGEAVLDEDGEPMMVPNPGRDVWITVTALTTALNLAIVTYAFSGLVLLFGSISVWTGGIFFALARRER